MGQKERNIINNRLANLKPTERRFRINAGMGWTAEKKNTVIKRLPDGTTNVYLKKARPFHGAPAGWADLCGWDEIEITADMVGQKIAVFAFEEAKATGVLSKTQKIFRDLLVRMGGIFRVIK